MLLEFDGLEFQVFSFYAFMLFFVHLDNFNMFIYGVDIFVFVLGDIVSQKVSWLPRTSKNCLRHGLDSIIEKVKITRKENKYETLNFIAKGASFEFLSSPLVCNIFTFQL